VRTSVARRYKFAGRHSLPSAGPPWSEPHDHIYTVEVVASAEDLPEGALVVPTDEIDAAWSAEWGEGPPTAGDHVDLDDLLGAENTSVEALAHRWLAELGAAVPEITSVTVWEDEQRWGRCDR
jgi:6-pyruvoyl-tetrahydropterin synthase